MKVLLINGLPNKNGCTYTVFNEISLTLNFLGKTVVPFITHGGGGKYTIKEDMGKLAKGSTVLEPLVVYEHGDSETDNKIKEWLQQIK